MLVPGFLLIPLSVKTCNRIRGAGINLAPTVPMVEAGDLTASILEAAPASFLPTCSRPVRKICALISHKVGPRDSVLCGRVIYCTKVVGYGTKLAALKGDVRTWKGDMMPFHYDPEQVRRIEVMLLKEVDRDGRIMVRSLDKIHARTGLNYATISEIARRLQERDFRIMAAS
jgi:hypothetical protein